MGVETCHHRIRLLAKGDISLSLTLIGHSMPATRPAVSLPHFCFLLLHFSQFDRLLPYHVMFPTTCNLFSFCGSTAPAPGVSAAVRATAGTRTTLARHAIWEGNPILSFLCPREFSNIETFVTLGNRSDPVRLTCPQPAAVLSAHLNNKYRSHHLNILMSGSRKIICAAHGTTQYKGLSVSQLVSNLLFCFEKGFL